MLPVLSRAERRRIEKVIHKTNDKEHARRLTAILMLHQGHTVSTVHRLTAAARSSIQRWLGWYQECGITGLPLWQDSCHHLKFNQLGALRVDSVSL